MVSAQLTGAEMVLQAFEDHKVDTYFWISRWSSSTNL